MESAVGRSSPVCPVAVSPRLREFFWARDRDRSVAKANPDVSYIVGMPFAARPVAASAWRLSQSSEQCSAADNRRTDSPSMRKGRGRSADREHRDNRNPRPASRPPRVRKRSLSCEQPHPHQRMACPKLTLEHNTLHSTHPAPAPSSLYRPSRRKTEASRSSESQVNCESQIHPNLGEYLTSTTPSGYGLGKGYRHAPASAGETQVGHRRPSQLSLKLPGYTRREFSREVSEGSPSLVGAASHKPPTLQPNPPRPPKPPPNLTPPPPLPA